MTDYEQEELLAKLFLHLDGANRLGALNSFESFKHLVAKAEVRLVPIERMECDELEVCERCPLCRQCDYCGPEVAQ